MTIDPMDAKYDQQVPIMPLVGEMIDNIESSNEWNDWRDAFVNQFYNEWLASRGH